MEKRFSSTNNSPRHIAIYCALGFVFLLVQFLLFYLLWSATAAIVCAVIELPILTWMVYEIVRAPIMEEEE